MHHRGICHKSLGAARLLLMAMAVLLGLGLMPGKATAQQASDQATAEVPQAQDHLMAVAPLNPLDCFDVTATVSLSGGSLEAGEFTFRLTDSAGSAMEATNQHSDLTGQNNYVNFEIPYGQVGTRTYRLAQENNPRYRCDTTVYEVTVTITQDMLGNKGASVTYSAGGKTVSQAAFSNGPLPPPSGQWVHEDGVTRYRTPQGAYASGWCTIDGQTYYFDTSGAHGRRTGWLQQGGTWYFLSPADGHRETGWIREGGAWYYLNPSTGAMATGWAWVNGAWYYLKGSGAMAVGWVFTGGQWYFLRSSGAMATGWIWTGGAWYYLAPGDGHMYRGWGFINGSWYFCDRSSGAMKTGWIWDGAWYYLYSSGAMAHNTAIEGYRLDSSGAWV